MAFVSIFSLTALIVLVAKYCFSIKIKVDVEKDDNL